MNLLQLSNFPFDLCFKVKWGQQTKKALYSFLLVLELRNVKTTYGKSCPVSLLQVSDLIFDTSFGVYFGHHVEKAFYLLYSCSLGF